MTIRLRYDQGCYVCESAFDERSVPKDAGFTWAKPIEKKWSTKDVDKALKLLAYADEPTKQRLLAAKQQRQDNLALSSAASSSVVWSAPEGMDYLPYQKAGIQWLTSRPATLLGDEMGLGKAQPLDAKLLTPNGWIAMGEVRAGMQVVGSNGLPCTVIGVYPQGEKEIYKVTMTDGSSTECCDDHLWLVNSPLRKWRGAAARVKTTRQIRNNLHHINGNLQHFIPMVEPVEFTSTAPLPIDPYLLGVLLGDGGIGNQQVIFTTADTEMVESVTQAIPIGTSIKPIGRYDYRINGPGKGIKNPVTQALREMGLLGTKSATKFIPDAYLYASVEDRIAILQGLLDTDGFVQPGTPTIEFAVASEDLVFGMQFIVQSLGGTFQYRQGKTQGQDRYRGTVRLPAYIPPFRLVRKLKNYQPRTKYPITRGIESVEFVGRKQAQCIAVDAPDHLYVTDDFIVTHNTIQVIGLINNDPSLTRILIVCPASLKLNWQRELEKWLVRDLSIGIADGSTFPGADIVIVNYDILHKLGLGDYEWDLVAADEVHYTKNAKARRSKALHAIDARIKVGMSGTPITNRPAELWPILHWLDPDTWPKFFPFAMRYCAAKQNGYGWDFTGASNLDELRTKLRSTLMIRRMKADVLTELPPKRRVIVPMPVNGNARLLERERNAYAQHQANLEEAQAAKDVAKASGDDTAYKEAVARLRTLTSVMFTEMARIRYETAMAKLPHVVTHLENILEDNDGYKVIVFAHHKDVIKELVQNLDKYKPVKLTGDDSMTARQAAVDTFQNDPACQVFVGNLQAAGVGITLTASSHVVFTELDWVPGNVSQAEDRAHRLGQTSSVLIEHLVFDGSLDAKMAKTIIDKQAIIDKALDRGETVDLSEPIVPLEEGVVAKVKRTVQEVVNLTQEQIAAVQEALGLLVGNDLDYAASRNSVGFNRYDVAVGHSLAGRTLTTAQARLGLKVISKYRRQLPEQLRGVLGL